CLASRGLPGEAQHQLHTVTWPQICRPLVTVILAEPLDGAAIDVLRARPQRAKLRRAKVTQRQGGHRPRRGARRGRARLAGQCGLIRAHEFRTVGQALQRHGFEARPAEVEPRLPVSIDKAVHVFGQTAHHSRSHSFASVASLGCSTVMIVILPVLSISTRAICTPAAVTALTALVTSCCRNVDGARAMARAPPMPESPERPERGESSWRQIPF